MIKTSIRLLKMKKNGIKNPLIVYQECKRTGVPLEVGCAVLEQESAGGDNVYGHDSDSHGHIIWHGQRGRVPVTKKNWQAYKTWRRALRNRYMQGAGPMMLTYYTYQDAADALGGCWNPRYNIRVGFQILASHKRHGYTWTEVFTRYNGSSLYGARVWKKVLRWKKILAGAKRFSHR